LGDRVCFIVDGFNLYHSLKDAQDQTGVDYRWLDIRGLCDSFLSALGQGATTESVHYFSALAHHRELYKPGTVARHQAYLAALAATGVTNSLANFKAKSIKYTCPSCHRAGVLKRHEEKETDVAVASKVIECAVGATADVVVVVSGDTDLKPAIQTARLLSPKPVHIIFPFMRHNNDIAAVATRTFTIKAKHYGNHQLPDPVRTPSGDVAQPNNWK